MSFVIALDAAVQGAHGAHIESHPQVCNRFHEGWRKLSVERGRLGITWDLLTWDHLGSLGHMVKACAPVLFGNTGTGRDN